MKPATTTTPPAFENVSDTGMPVISGMHKTKVKSLDQLAEVLDRHRAKNQKIVHCHGVYDLLHIGHIRHFEEAKKHGDILVVTLTQDEHVNKGPHRPAFPQDLRAETIAALGCVDYVAINCSPMAIDSIKLLRPNFYVKGSDYKDANKDVTGGITLEQEAVESVGGQLIFTDDIVFSSSTLINEHLPVFSRELSAYLKGFSSRYSIDDVTGYLDRMRPLKVLTIGEAIIDEYNYCTAIGKSSKEPMLVVKCSSTEKFAGGILAVGNNAAGFADDVSVLSFLGDTESHEDFIRASLKANVKAQFLSRDNSPTIVKKRFIESYFFHKLLAVYNINDSEMTKANNELFCSTLEKIVPEFDVVVVVDFGHSVMTPEAAQVISQKAKFLAVNTQSNAGSLGYQTIFKYPKADFVCITEDELRLEMRERTGDVTKLIPQLASDVHGKRVMITRGKNGCIGYSQEEGFVEIPATATQVVDRMGAGDTFLSVSSLAAALNAPLEVVGFIGNAAGAQAVATVGHRNFINRVSLTKFVTSLLK